MQSSTRTGSSATRSSAHHGSSKILTSFLQPRIRNNKSPNVNRMKFAKWHTPMFRLSNSVHGKGSETPKVSKLADFLKNKPRKHNFSEKNADLKNVKSLKSKFARDGYLK